MVFINDQKKEFQTYILDDINSILNRLASELKTTSDYLYFPAYNEPPYYPPIEIFKNENKDILLVENVANEIKRDNYLDGIINSVKDKLPRLSIRYKVIPIWLAFNERLQSQIEKAGGVILEQIWNKIKGEKYFPSKKIFLELWEKRQQERDKFNLFLEITKKNSQRTLELFKYFEETEEWYATKPSLVQTTFSIFLTTVHKSFLDLFNDCVLNKNAPFATTKNFYKFLKNFQPREDWDYSPEDNMIVKVQDKKDIPEYNDIILSINSGSVIASSSLDIDEKTIDQKTFINRFISIFKPDKKTNVIVDKIVDSEVIGIFYLPLNRFFNKHIFQELVMNDDLFSKLMQIDESIKATKKKSELIAKIFSPSDGKLYKINITQKKIQKNNPLHQQDKELWPVGTYYLYVRVSANNIQTLKTLQTILLKLITIYYEKYDEIIKIYRQFIPTFGSVKIEKTTEIKDVKLSDIAPSVFVSNYTRFCSEYPIIVSEEEAKKSDPTSVLKFPRDKSKTSSFPHDGEDQHWYKCGEHTNPKFKDYKFPGLKKNNSLKNSEEYPYLPCCYKVDQTEKMKHYYQNILPTRVTKYGQSLIKTDKILKPNIDGELPPKLTGLFRLLNPDPTFVYLRRGVFRNENSFLGCVMTAMDKLGIETDNSIEMETYLVGIREKLIQNVLIPLCKQELYDFSIKQIIEKLKDNNVYLDPKLFIHLLEEYFECNIFLFTQNDDMILPTHTQAYYKTRNRLPCIYIYEHIGSESDAAKYPQCEMIVRFNKKNGELEQQFSYKDAKSIRKLYKLLRSSYALNNPIPETIGLDNITTKVEVKNQVIDSYGKTRRIDIQYDNKNISLLTSPIQPIMALSLERKNNIPYLVTPETALVVAKYLDIVVTYQIIHNKLLYEIEGRLGNITINIPVKPSSSIIENLDQKLGLNYSPSTKSSLDIYNRNKKLSRYLTDHVFWEFSKYLYDQKIQINDENMANFAFQKLEIQNDYKYKDDISKTLSQNNSFYNENKNLIITSKETLKRLMYVLRLATIRENEKILQYRNRTTIENYYEDINDFKQYPTQIILYGENSVYKWLYENRFGYKLHDSVTKDFIPYFFKNKLIDDNIYIAQNATSLERAFDIGMTWINKGFNPGIYSKNRNIIENQYTLYSYKNPNMINLVKQGNKKIKIMGYLIRNEDVYTVLLGF